MPFDGSFAIADAASQPDADWVMPRKAGLSRQVRRIAEAQRVLYANDRYAALLIFQAMDAAGKDSTIRAVFSGVNPAGCHVVSFKQPGATELDHDFLWRTAKELPPRGKIGVFNRSYYEEVLVVRVHPEILETQKLPPAVQGPDLFAERFTSIRDHEAHLARNGVLVLKFFLNVSPEEQRRRFLARLRTPRKHWKFSASDVEEADHRDKYMEAYQDALNETSRPWSPWYSIPADNKKFMRWQVASIVADAMEGLDLHYPALSAEHSAEIRRLRSELQAREKGEKPR